MRRLPRSFFARDALVVAPDLLHKVFVVGGCSGRIIEVEAYVQDDPASHSHRGRTPRNAAMFGPPGHLYVYFTYGMHHCANVVTGVEGDGQAVLIRAIIPLTGEVEMAQRRPPGTPHHRLANGPGKLCQAFGLDLSHDGADLCRRSSPVWIGDDGAPPPKHPVVTGRIGIRVGVEHPWRWLAP